MIPDGVLDPDIAASVRRLPDSPLSESMLSFRGALEAIWESMAN